MRVVQGYTTAPTNTELVTPPTVTDDTNSATYFVRNLGAFTYSFHTTYNDAVAAINPKDITNALPTTGEIIIAGENDALAFLGQTPINESLVPASTKTTLTTTTGPLVTGTDTTNDTVDLASAVTWVSGDRVQVSATGGGLTVGHHLLRPHARYRHRQLPHHLGGRNSGAEDPRFREWLMGFPDEWTVLPPSATPSSRRRRAPSSNDSPDD